MTAAGMSPGLDYYSQRRRTGYARLTVLKQTCLRAGDGGARRGMERRGLSLASRLNGLVEGARMGRGFWLRSGCVPPVFPPL